MLVVITPPEASKYEAQVATRLFEEGLHTLLLRLPRADVGRYVAFLEAVDPCHHHKIILSDHYELLERFSLGGIYVSGSRVSQSLPELEPHQMLALGIHDLDELACLPFSPDVALLSPVFDSISKSGYRANTELLKIREQLQAISIPILAMGGVTSANVEMCYHSGFDGVAVLGDIWGHRGREVSKFRSFAPSSIISLAGHDPSGGAGIVADVRISESIGVRCLTIPTTLTIQSEDKFEVAFSTEKSYICSNTELNIPSSPIRVAKIGMTSSWEMLSKVVADLKGNGVKWIIWDPIVKPTAGKDTVLSPDKYRTEVKTLMKSLYLVTPNWIECVEWFGTDDLNEIQHIVDETDCRLLIKGGHRESNHDNTVDDILLRPNVSPLICTVPKYGAQKHGTGCALSSAIAAFLAIGYALPKACQEAQRVVSKLMRIREWYLPPISSVLSQDTKQILLRGHRLQYITNTSDPDLLLERCQTFLDAGGRWVQLRMKDSTTLDRVKVGRDLRVLCDKYNAVLIVDDDVRAALEIAADGVHLGKDDVSPLEARQVLGRHSIIGYTCNTQEDLIKAYHYGCDYVGIGPFRETKTKKKLAAILGTEGVREMAMFNKSSLSYPLPMVAIGGITLADVEVVLSAGVSGIAVSGALDVASDMYSMCGDFVSQIEKYKKI